MAKQLAAELQQHQSRPPGQLDLALKATTAPVVSKVRNVQVIALHVEGGMDWVLELG
jgi:hypothetical protein